MSFPAVAQQMGRVWRIGFLSSNPRPPDGSVPAPLRKAMQALGYGEGKDIVYEGRWAEVRNEQLPALAAELVALKVDLIVTTGGPAAAAARTADRTGESKAPAGRRESRNGRGRRLVFAEVLHPKRLQLLREVVPAKRVGVLKNPTNFMPVVLERMTAAASSLGIDLMWVDAQSPGELAEAFAKMRQEGVKALLVANDAMFFSQRARIVNLAATHRIPAVYAEREFADAGGLMAYAPNGSANFRRAATYVDKILIIAPDPVLNARREQLVALAARYAVAAVYEGRESVVLGGLMSYGPSLSDAYRQVGIYTGRILNGAKPADLPVLQPTKFELVINLKTAKALGLTIPQLLLLRADEVIR